MVIELHEALEAAESYFSDDTRKPYIIGSMAGVKLFKHLFDLGLGTFNFNETLLIEGCQDYMGMSDPSPVHNHFFWADLIKIIPYHKNPAFSININPFEFRLLNNGNPVSEYTYEFDFQLINTFKLVYVCDAHLIPQRFFEQLIRFTQGKLIMLIDPFTVYGIRYTNIPTVIRALGECDPLTAMARNIFGVETDYVTAKNPTTINGLRQSAPKTLSKCNETPMCSNDIAYIQYMQDKQIGMGIKKNQRIIIDDPIFKRFKADDKVEDITVTEHSLLTTESVPGILHSNSLCKPWRYKNACYMHFKYAVYNEPMTSFGNLEDNTVVKVRPACVMTLNDIAHHKFEKLVFVQSRMKDLSNVEKYTLLTSTEHLTIMED